MIYVQCGCVEERVEYGDCRGGGALQKPRMQLPDSQRESGYDHEKMDSKARETQCVCVSREADVDRPLSGGASANTRP